MDAQNGQMGNSLLFFRRSFCGADVHAPVEGHRVEGQDFRIQMFGQLQAEFGLAAGGGTGQKPALFQDFRGKLHGEFASDRPQIAGKPDPGRWGTRYFENIQLG